MNIVRIVLLLLMLLIGLIVGAKNSTEVDLNFLFTTLHTTIGIAIIVSLLIGVIVGSGVILFFTLIPTYAKLRKTHKQLAEVRQNQNQLSPSAEETPRQQSQTLKKD